MNKPKLIRNPKKSKYGADTEAAIEKNTPAYNKRDFSCPAYFNEEEKAEWAELVELIKSIKNGAVTDADKKQMIIRCQSWIEYKRYDAKIKEKPNPYLIETKYDMGKPVEQIVKNPYYDLKKKAAELVIKCDSNLGLDPISRARIGLARVKADKDYSDDTINRLLNRKGDND